MLQKFDGWQGEVPYTTDVICICTTQVPIEYHIARLYSPLLPIYDFVPRHNMDLHNYKIDAPSPHIPQAHMMHGLWKFISFLFINNYKKYIIFV